MPSSLIQNNITVIIAHRGSDRHLQGVILDLQLWFNDIVVVGPYCNLITEKIDDLKKAWVKTDSFNLLELWEKGIRSKESSWYLLLESREYLSTVLKESILETAKSNPGQKTWFPIKRNIILFKQRLKYQLQWTHDPISGLLFCGVEKTPELAYLMSLDKLPLTGESNYFGENNIFEGIQNTKYRADQAADKLYQENPSLNKLKLTSKALIGPLPNIFRNLIVCRGIREGFEGFAFSLLDVMSEVLGYLRYYEKYIRSGKQTQDQLNSVKKVLVIKLRGLGDAVLATPVLKNLKTFMPNVSISVLTFNFCTALFENNPNVDEIHGLSGNSSSHEIKKIIKALSDKKFDLIINLHSRNFSSKIAKKIKARWRINRSHFLREKYSDVLIGCDHELDRTSIERDLDCLRAIGLNRIEKKPEIFITNDEIKWTEGFLAQEKINPLKKLIIIHPSSSQDNRNWGMERFVVLSRMLIDNHGHQILGCFSEKEQSVAKLLREQVKGVFIHAGSLRKSIALISRADLMIDNASGPSHISSALNIPTIVLMGPQDYKNTYYDQDIHKEKSFLFYRDVPCRDLLMSQCLPPDPCQNRICMDHSVEAVLKKSLEILGHDNG